MLRRFALALAATIALGATAIESLAQEPPRGVIVEGMKCRNDPTQTFTLYLPSTYGIERSWPLLYVFDPRGRGTAAAEIFKDAAERYGWIVASSDNTLSDGPTEPNERALQAMWPDVRSRFRVDPKRIYAAGFSGTVVVAMSLAWSSGQIAGVIGSGGRLPPMAREQPVKFPFFGTAGIADFNFLEMKSYDELLSKRGTPRRVEVFDGEHQWLTPELADVALRWFELLAMRDGRRARDEAFVKGALDAERASAETLDRSGRIVDAARAYGTIVDTFTGLADTAFARERLAALMADKALVRALENERRWDGWEERTLREVSPAIVRLRDDEITDAPRQIASQLKAEQLRAQLKRTGYEADAARRVRSWIVSQVSFYIWRDLMQSEAFMRAAFVQQVAVELVPDSPVVFYRLAASYARAKQAGRALDALEKAVALGLQHPERLIDDENFATLASDARFSRLAKAK